MPSLSSTSSSLMPELPSFYFIQFSSEGAIFMSSLYHAPATLSLKREGFTHIWFPGLFTSNTPVIVATIRGPTEQMDLEAKVACVPEYYGK